MIQLKIDSLSELDHVAEQIISSLGGRNVVLFRGGMGAGKTTLISRIVALLGSEDTVTSPTFALVNEYEGDEGLIYHFDFYRIESEDEAFDLGTEDYFDSGALCFIEWPERIENLLPGDTVEVVISVNQSDNSRTISVE